MYGFPLVFRSIISALDTPFSYCSCLWPTNKPPWPLLNGHHSVTTGVSRYQNGKPLWILLQQYTWRYFLYQILLHAAPPGEYRHSTISVKAHKAINNQQTNNAQISQNSFTLWLSSKFAVSWWLKISPHCKCVAATPCETSVFGN